MREKQYLNNCPFLCSWSGGKDSYFAFYLALQQGLRPAVLLNTLNEFGDRSRSHGIPKQLLQEQARLVGLPIEFIETTWASYEEKYVEKLVQLKRKYAFTQAVFGDIDIDAHRAWEEKVSEAAAVEAVLPIWQMDRKHLVVSMIDVGMKCLIVSCRRELADSILGKVITRDLLRELENLGIDVCGENGEYHTLVTDGPLHKWPLKVKAEGWQNHGDYSFVNFRTV